MQSVRRVSFTIAWISLVLVGSLNAQTRPPQVFGTSEYTLTMIPAVAFVAGSSTTAYFTSGSVGRIVEPSAIRVDFYSALDIPAGH